MKVFMQAVEPSSWKLKFSCQTQEDELVVQSVSDQLFVAAPPGLPACLKQCLTIQLLGWVSSDRSRLLSPSLNPTGVSTQGVTLPIIVFANVSRECFSPEPFELPCLWYWVDLDPQFPGHRVGKWRIQPAEDFQE